MNTTNPLAINRSGCRTDQAAPVRHWFSVLWQHARRQPAAPSADAGTLPDPWASAISQIDHLDAHVLNDIGAPRWVIEEVDRRQQYDSVLNAGRKW